ncbi:olfactory receptor 2A25-like [Latimeria chalumnae]|uniref:olfactory receptor 2A25-like n=1 Tax=Latimeria chalumnae TaxID=7897 RepID=UPI00313A7B45
MVNDTFTHAGDMKIICCSLLPHLMANLLSETKTISYTGCFIQIFCLHNYGNVELIILTVMAYDRYIAICNPLRYSTIMTKEKVCKLLITAWLFVIGALFVLIGNRVNSKTVPSFVTVILSLEFLVIPPLINPIIYGVRTEKIRNAARNIFRKGIYPSLKQ